MINMKVVIAGFILSVVFITSSLSPIFKLREKRKSNDNFTETDRRRLNYLEKLFLAGALMFIGSIYYTLKYFFFSG